MLVRQENNIFTIVSSCANYSEFSLIAQKSMLITKEKEKNLKSIFVQLNLVLTDIESYCKTAKTIPKDVQIPTIKVVKHLFTDELKLS